MTTNVSTCLGLRLPLPLKILFCVLDNILTPRTRNQKIPAFTINVGNWGIKRVPWRTYENKQLSPVMCRKNGRESSETTSQEALIDSGRNKRRGCCPNCLNIYTLNMRGICLMKIRRTGNRHSNGHKSNRMCTRRNCHQFTRTHTNMHVSKPQTRIYLQLNIARIFFPLQKLLSALVNSRGTLTFVVDQS